jgi:small subunit ribosomal protein S2
MRPFIYGTRFNVCIFDLDETALLLRQALNFLAHLSYRGGVILFIARQPQVITCESGLFKKLFTHLQI